jgi:hypothetical protein
MRTIYRELDRSTLRTVTVSRDTRTWAEALGETTLPLGGPSRINLLDVFGVNQEGRSWRAAPASGTPGPVGHMSPFVFAAPCLKRTALGRRY